MAPQVGDGILTARTGPFSRIRLRREVTHADAQFGPIWGHVELRPTRAIFRWSYGIDRWSLDFKITARWPLRSH